jgi:glycosyltransferase involved in cell wall biosynthesis
MAYIGDRLAGEPLSCMKKKIAFIHVTGSPVMRGEELSFTEGGLVHALSASVDLTHDYDITIICPNLPGNHGKRVINYKGVEIVCLGNSRWVKWSRFGDLSFFRETYKYIRKEKPDILIANNYLMSLLVTFIPQKAIKVGIIHHLYHTQSVDGSSTKTVRSIGILEKLAIHLIKLNKVGVVNPRVKSILAKEGYPEDKIVIVGNGVNVDDYLFSESKVPHSLIYIGRIAELKEVSSLVEVVSIIRKEIPDITLHIIGDGPKYNEVKERTEELKVSSNIIMHGCLTEKEKTNLLMDSTIYVSNSQMEGFGIPLVEAMATGAVPVVSDIYAHRFVFQDEDVGYLVHNKEEMAARIIDLLTNEPKRLQLARNGRELVERKWTWTGVSEKYRELLQTPINAN